MTMRDDDNVIGERLGRALEGEALRNPLPSDFAATAAANVDDRSVRRSGWFSSFPVVAATVLLAIVAIAVPLSLIRSPTTPGPAASGPSMQQPSATASAMSSPTLLASPTPDASPRPLSRAEAEEAAIRADGRPGMTTVSVEFGPARQVLSREGFERADVPSDDTWVWLIVVSDGGPPLGQEGSFVVLDYFDGTVYGVQKWIS